MATSYAYTTQNSSSCFSSSQRALAMVVAIVSAVVLSPLYVHRKNEFESRWGSGFVLPMVLAGLIIAIKTTSSSSSSRLERESRTALFPGGSDPSWVLRIGSSSWGLGGVLVMLILVLSWQDSVQHFLWR